MHLSEIIFQNPNLKEYEYPKKKRALLIKQRSPFLKTN